MTMQRKHKLTILAVGALAVAGVGANLATAGGGDDPAPITGDALERATAAAVEHTGGGRVTETEQGDEESFYEVEVTMDDGTQIDVQLDEDFNVVGDETDGADEDGDGSDDD